MSFKTIKENNFTSCLLISLSMIVLTILTPVHAENSTSDTQLVLKFLEKYKNDNILHISLDSIKSIYEEILTIKHWIEKTLVTDVSDRNQIISAYHVLPKKECVFEKQTAHHLMSTITKTDKIKLFEIIRFNLKKKNRLKEIYQTYESEEFVVELLSELYSREIKSLNDLIFVNKK